MKGYFSHTLIIPFTYSKNNIKYLQKILKNKPEYWEVIIVYLDEVNRIEYYNLNCDIIFFNSKKYNMGWMYNIGLKYSRTEKNVFCPLGKLFDYDFLGDKKIKDNVFFYNKKSIHGLLGWEQELSKPYIFDLQKEKSQHSLIDGVYKEMPVDEEFEQFSDTTKDIYNWIEYKKRVLEKIASPYFIYT